MLVMLLQVVLLLGFAAALLIYLKTKRHHDMTKHIPAPPRLPLLNHGLAFLGDRSTILSRLSTILDNYDDFAPLWAGPEHLIIFISHPDDLQTFFSSSKLTDRNRTYKFVENGLGRDSLFTTNGDVWRKNRRLISPSFHPNVLKSFPKIFYKHSDIFVDVVRKEVGQEFDVLPYMRRLTFDLISETSMDYDMNAQTKGSQLLTDMMRAMEIIGERVYKPWLHPDFIFNMTPLGRECNKAIKDARDAGTKYTKENQEFLRKSRENREQTKQDTFIYHLMAAGFEPEQMLDQIFTITATGMDTSSLTLAFVMMMLGMHQEVQEKLYQEVVAVEEVLAGKEVNMEDLDKYDYMERVFKETMRLFPLGPFLGRTATDDIKFRKYTVPKGAEVAAAMFKTQRDPRFFTDPLRFDPDRFLPENSEGRHPYCFLPFSAGPRNCIGMKYGMMSMKIIVSRFLLHYKVHCRLTIPELKIKPDITIKVVGGWMVSIEERKKA